MYLRDFSVILETLLATLQFMSRKYDHQSSLEPHLIMISEDWSLFVISLYPIGNPSLPHSFQNSIKPNNQYSLIFPLELAHHLSIFR